MDRSFDQALISGRVGRAVLMEKTDVFALAHGQDEPVHAPWEHAAWLLRPARDVETLIDVSLVEVRDRLRLAVSREQALDLFLIVVDSSYPNAIRHGALADLSLLLADQRVVAAVESIVFSVAAPEAADLNGALLLATTHHVARSWLKRLQQYQPAIVHVSHAWKTFAHAYDGGLDLSSVEVLLTRESVFRDVAVGIQENVDLTEFGHAVDIRPLHKQDGYRDDLSRLVRDWLRVAAERVEEWRAGIDTGVGQQTYLAIGGKQTDVGLAEDIHIDGNSWASIPNHDKPQLLDRIHATVVHLYRACRFREGLMVATRACALSSGLFGTTHPTYARHLGSLAAMHHAQGILQTAEDLYAQATEIQKASFGISSAEVALSLSNLARTKEAMGRYSEALTLHDEALAIRRSLVGREDLSVAESLDNLSRVYRAVGRHDDAKAAEAKATALFEKLLTCRDCGDVFSL